MPRYRIEHRYPCNPGGGCKSIKDKENNYRITNREIDMEEIEKTMTLEEALGLVDEVKNCSLPWDDAHYEALSIIVEYVKKQITIAPIV